MPISATLLFAAYYKTKKSFYRLFFVFSYNLRQRRINLQNHKLKIYERNRIRNNRPQRGGNNTRSKSHANRTIPKAGQASIHKTGTQVHSIPSKRLRKTIAGLHNKK